MHISDLKTLPAEGEEEIEKEGHAQKVEYENILETIGFGNTQLLLLLISGLLTVTSLATQTSAGLMVLGAQCEFSMSQREKGIMMAACVAGVFLSTYFWGYVSDAIGRRTVLLIGTFVTNLLQLVTMFVTRVWIFNLINLIMGMSLGGISAAIYAYLSEFNVPRYRVIVINYSTMFVSVAAIYAPAVAWLVLPAKWSVELLPGFVFYPWRLLILFNILPGLIGALLLLTFPESPKLLLAQSKEEEAKTAIAWICRFNTGRTLSEVIQLDHFTLQPEILSEDNVLSRDNGSCGFVAAIWHATAPLLHKPHRRNFLISALTVFCLFFSSSGMQVWYPEIVNRSTNEVSNTSSTVCEILDTSFERQHASNMSMMAESDTSSQDCHSLDISAKTFVDNIIVGVAFLLGFILQGALLNPIGRKNLLLASLAISTLSGILLLVITNAVVVLVLFCLFILLPGLSISIMCGAVVDLVPTHLRGKAMSICLTLGRLGVIVATNLIGITLEPFCNSTFGIFTASMIAAMVLVHFLPI